MSGLEEAVTLLQAAHRDLQALTGMLDREVFADKIFGFHVQQSAEKSLKTWLAALDGLCVQGFQRQCAISLALSSSQSR